MSIGERRGVKLQPRDFALLRGLFESRVMTLSHAAVLYFGRKYEMAKKRVQLLKAARIIRERPRQFSDPSVLFLTRKAFQILRDSGELADYPKIGVTELEKRAQVSQQTLRHELAVMDVKVAMMGAINNTAMHKVSEFTTWPRLSEFRACRLNGEQVIVKPDGFIRIREQSADGEFEHAFFLEVDRSTETLDVLCQRCHCYLDYYRSGGFAVRAGVARDRYKDHPFRVLVICKSEARIRSVAEKLLNNNPPIRTHVWLTTLADVAAKPLAAIWMRPADCADAIAIDVGSPASKLFIPKHSLLHDA